MAHVQTFFVTEGNVVHKTTETILTREERRELELERQKQEKKRRARAKVRALRKQKLNTVFMTLGSIVICAMLISYVTLCNSITTHRKNVSNLESEIADIKLAISATESRIEISTNLAEVKAAAIEELGMDYASSDQIVYYSIDNDDYMSQYQDIP